MEPFHPNLQQNSPLRSPDWRWRRAHWLVAHRRYFSPQRDDMETGKAAHYLRGLARNRYGTHRETVTRFPEVHAALRLHEAGGATKLLVQARLLARQRSIEIALLTAVPVEVVDTYQSLFFHCRDRLDARDWVALKLIGYPAIDRATTADPGDLLKSFAYYGGAHVLNAVLPYLLSDTDLLRFSTHLSTRGAQHEQTVRIAVAAKRLPRDTATEKKLHKIMLLLLEIERRRPVQSPPPPILAREIDSKLRQLTVGASFEQSAPEQTMVSAAVPALARQIA